MPEDKPELEREPRADNPDPAHPEEPKRREGDEKPAGWDSNPPPQQPPPAGTKP